MSTKFSRAVRANATAAIATFTLAATAVTAFGAGDSTALQPREYRGAEAVGPFFAKRIDINGVVNVVDLGMLKQQFMGPPGPSALAP